MGIPKMFRFLTDRYPLIMQRLDEDHVFDHFYLDMNGIIHQCTHPSDSEIAVDDFDSMMDRILHYTERLFRIVSPTKLMFLAVDGVAPRAKMNQQRSRRFRSAKDAERTMAEYVARGDDAVFQNNNKKPFDSNCITPGTQFMYDLSARFRQWIHDKMSNDVAFQQGCSIVFSGPDVPGEGEHKIMDYIRNWKNSDRFDPSTRHCMYGLDADLMMLGLVAHVPFFTLLRERIRYSRSGRIMPKMNGTDRDAEEFQLLEVAMLRDMLFLEFKRGPDDDPFQRPEKNGNNRRNQQQPQQENRERTSTSPPRKSFQYNSRRVVDDFVFMCMLVGNDFIPNIPHLEISDGAINQMFSVYKRMVPLWGGYLTDKHRLHPDRLESFFSEIAQSELQYFHNRARTDDEPLYQGLTYRRAYYNLKFKFDVEDESTDSSSKLLELRRIYMEGLHWVLQYYHNGVSSWNWFYPNFYAVLASDMTDLRSVKVSFRRGKPFRSLTQLMAVLPPESAQFLPSPMRDLMTNPSSPIVDFYPSDFSTDMNGKRNDWEAVVVVPFIDEKRLLTEVSKIDREKDLTPMEKLRDKTGTENWFYEHKYPRATRSVRPVRPSKFTPQYKRSRSSSPVSNRNGRNNNNQNQYQRQQNGGSSNNNNNSNNNNMNNRRRQPYSQSQSQNQSNSESSFQRKPGSDSAPSRRQSRSSDGSSRRQFSPRRENPRSSPSSSSGTGSAPHDTNTGSETDIDKGAGNVSNDS